MAAAQTAENHGDEWGLWDMMLMRLMWMRYIHQQGFMQAVLLKSVFWTKIEFSNVVKCIWGSQGAVSPATDS